MIWPIFSEITQDSVITTEVTKQEERLRWEGNHSQEIHMAKKEIKAEKNNSLHVGLSVSAPLFGNFSYTPRLSWFEETGLLISATR